jgi:hypothetical protein
MSGTLAGRYTVHGDNATWMGTLTMGSTSTTATVRIPGIRRIEAFTVTPVSGATSVYSMHPNTGSATTAINGELGITSALSSNIFSVIVYGDA